LAFVLGAKKELKIRPGIVGGMLLNRHVLQNILWLHTVEIP